MQNFDKMDHMHFIRKLPIPQELKKEMPLTPELAAYKDKRDQEIAAIIRSESDKLLLVIGPCSADREDAVIDYIHRLAEVQKQVADKILIVPRIYTGKPRTTAPDTRVCSTSRTRAKSRICTRVFAPFAIFTCVPCRRPGCLVQTRCCTRRITGI